MIQSFNQIRLTNSIVNASGGILTVGGSGVLYTNQTGLFYPASNPSGFITAAQAGGVQSLSVTGDIISGVVGISGSGISIFTGAGNQIVFGLNTGQFVTTGNTGSFITTSQTGLFYPSTNPSGYITTGQTGIFATTTSLNATGALFATYTGNSQTFTANLLPTGNISYFISFPFNFTSPPRVLVTLEVTGSYLYGVGIAGRTVSGFNALLSDYIAESGVSLDVYATLN